MKKTLAVVGAIALAGVLSVTAAGCSKTTRNYASLSSNWYYDTGFKRIQPTFNEESAEKLTYMVYQAVDSSEKAAYKLEYADGTYTTEFYAKKITSAELAGITYENWREDYTKALGSNGMYLYYYRTVLDIPAITFTFKGESKTFTNQGVETESYFLSVENHLSPVYTKRTVNMPVAEYQPLTLDGCYMEVDMVYESFYTLSGSSVMTFITDNNAEGEKTTAFSIGGLGGYANSVFDVSYLDIVARAIRNVSGAFSQTIGIYTPGLEVGSYTVASSAKALFDGKDAETNFGILQSKLVAKGLFTPQPVDENDPEKGVTALKTSAVSIAYNGGQYSGLSQTYWFAVDDVANQTRTVMVKYSEPLPYNLGRIDYVLDKIDNIYV